MRPSTGLCTEDIRNFSMSIFQKLLQHPELSNSQLLEDFPSPRGLASQFVDKMLPDVNLAWTNIPVEHFRINWQLFNDLFKNNANRLESTEKKHNQNYFMEMITVEGVYIHVQFVKS
ncbi:hypothetical protein J4Q44_G00221620 [Coregonus suidteri]|uniref:Uncharacterized protein n=1 Tax=Coregonus suidteri TaxID=861788 RepID=A0AAN8L918_9TELE